jgi:hypothetical protein
LRVGVTTEGNVAPLAVENTQAVSLGGDLF